MSRWVQHHPTDGYENNINLAIKNCYKFVYLACEFTFGFCVLTPAISEEKILNNDPIYLKMGLRKYVNWIHNFIQVVCIYTF
jgi:hypothetical protein